MGTGKPCLAAMLGVWSLGILALKKVFTKDLQSLQAHLGRVSRKLNGLGNVQQSGLSRYTSFDTDCTVHLQPFNSCFLLRSSTALQPSLSTHFSTYNKIPTLTIISTDGTILTVKFCMLMLESVYGSYLITALELDSAQIWPWNCRLSLVPMRYTWWAEAETET